MNTTDILYAPTPVSKLPENTTMAFFIKSKTGETIRCVFSIVDNDPINEIWIGKYDYWLKPVKLSDLLKEAAEKSWNEGIDAILKSIAQMFLNPENQDKADLQRDKAVFQAIGEKIQSFPRPQFK